MIQTVVAAFVGCFAAIVVIAEVQMKSKVMKYLLALLGGTLLAILLAYVLQWMLKMLGQAH